ncbi:hypothetical protein ALI22I_01900 [Saccharothrix sp. ALI-22-I]|uniref:hypothetical protein n=1 Tax=Saccharothrix sp. ALI-22-I TaxID=1933778 RepID=UPI00097C7E23|nr:hypothetical protein [Saccharothrix sp. ALI-22-I]ONI92803.1 hypothetical protein ALI22I_01900 [Saccharothrix sp. ALI-22-I]
MPHWIGKDGRLAAEAGVSGDLDAAWARPHVLLRPMVPAVDAGPTGSRQPGTGDIVETVVKGSRV